MSLKSFTCGLTQQTEQIRTPGATLEDNLKGASDNSPPSAQHNVAFSTRHDIRWKMSQLK